MKNPVGWFEIYVSDIKRAKNFYESVFKFKFEELKTPVPDLEMWSFPKAANSMGCTGALCKMKGFEPGHNSVLIYFMCDDCAVEEKRVAEFGGKVQKPKMT